ncbi:MAG: NAD(P)/FAD-dependent oxidoreductase [Oscillibacter sp.]|nr:NAD(P)/FAD-dependent oxidoreductase [Oscillibacter sp.]MBQ2996009.1 NAD(P)/FAD-dependent oxidoreductase [Oscillibacter sp.]
MENLFDVLIVGGGAVGCAIARELTRTTLSVAVLEKEADVAGGTSGRNSAVVHAGFNNKVGSLMAKYCVEGNEGFEALCAELDVPYNKTGKVLVAFNDEEMKTLERLVAQGEKNGCKGLRLIDKEELTERVPGVGGVGGMLSPNTAIFDPFLYTVALAENAVKNGAQVFLNTAVTAISKENDLFAVETTQGTYHAKMLVNAAGLYSDKVAAMAGVEGYHIYPCRGEYLILDKIAKDYLSVPVYPAPAAGIGGLGVHLTPTIHGNIIVGPSNEYIEEYDDCATTQEVLDKLFREAQMLMPALQRKDIIGSYSGLRSKQAPPEEGGFRDFTIVEEPAVPGLIDLIGIESPGMTASMPIAKRVAAMVCDKLQPGENTAFDPTHKGILRFADQTPEMKAKLIAEDSDYGEVICRCQQVTKKEICEAIENPLGAKTISAIKYRVWPTTGRCQGGYCLTRIAEILEKEYGIAPEHITQRGEGSELFSGRVK